MKILKLLFLIYLGGMFFCYSCTTSNSKGQKGDAALTVSADSVTGRGCFDIITEIPYDIPAGRFDETAQQLAHATGCFIETDLAKTGAVKVNAVKGKISIRDAVHMAIKGTALQVIEETADKIKVELIP